MATTAVGGFCFAPSRVEGLPNVTAVAVFPDRIELLSAGTWVAYQFIDLARWYRRGWLYRPLARLGWIRGWPSVADRDWFHFPADRFFRFYSDPAVTIYMPIEPSGLDYGETVFRQVQDVIGLGGFSTFDLG